MKRKIVLILVGSLFLGGIIQVREYLVRDEIQLERNGYGEGNRTENFLLQVEGEDWEEEMRVEVGEQEYTTEEVADLFQEILGKLDEVVLDENESFDRVEKNLNLTKRLEDYPVEIGWELSSYKVMDSEGKLREEKIPEEGFLVELRGNISYFEEQVIYVRNAMIYPRKLEGKDFILYEIERAVEAEEERTKTEKEFSLPKEVNGKKLQWKGEKKKTGYYVVFLGVMCSVFLVYRKRENEKEKKKKRQEQLKREYPAMVSKLNMLLGTGITVRSAWEKIVASYEANKEHSGQQVVYEEMGLTLKEIQSGISEGEAYERFGKRCEITEYLKLGALLAQNLRKGSRGISDLLRMEAIQSFENRKSLAKRRGEEAGTKMMLPMMGMLAVVMIMVMVPAFLSMQM